MCDWTVAGRFDAVVDFSAYTGRSTREATTLLRHKTDLYVHISTDSVYDVCDTENRDDAPVQEYQASAVHALFVPYYRLIVNIL